MTPTLPPLAERFFAVRHGVTFLEVLATTATNPTIVAQYDRLRGTNIGGKGSGLELMIDKATGRVEKEYEAFVEFVWDVVFMRFGGPENKKPK